MTEPMPAICFLTMGCPKNEADTNRMQTLLARAGYRIVDSPACCDVVFVNTCSFITEATEESIATIFDVLSDEGFMSNGSKLVVAGCMPSRFGHELEESLTEAAAFLPASEEDSVVELVDRLLGRHALSCACNGDDADASGTTPADLPARDVSTPMAYVKISDGCDRFCSYCTIPFIRGRYRSRTFEDIADEVDLLVSQGVREVVLIGQDTGIWGNDLPGSPTLATLMDRLADRHPDLWIRVLYLQPEGVTDELLDVFCAHDNICDYLDIPLQHADADILRDMNRTGDAEAFLACIDHIRERIPDAALRTTLIAGFPGETREQARANGKLIERADFDYVGVFPYSKEEGTRAGMRTDQVPMRTRRARAQRLRDLADELAFRRMQERVGKVYDVLVEGTEDEGDRVELIGRMRSQAPDVDGAVHIPQGSARIGQVVKVRLTGTFCYEYEGEVV